MISDSTLQSPLMPRPPTQPTLFACWMHNEPCCSTWTRTKYLISFVFIILFSSLSRRCVKQRSLHPAAVKHHIKRLLVREQPAWQTAVGQAALGSGGVKVRLADWLTPSRLQWFNKLPERFAWYLLRLLWPCDEPLLSGSYSTLILHRGGRVYFIEPCACFSRWCSLLFFKLCNVWTFREKKKEDSAT